MKKLSILMVLCLLFGLLSTFTACTELPVETTGEPNATDAPTTPTDAPTDTPTDKPTDNNVKEERSIDIYIVAGQSNAAGYTPATSSVLNELWDKSSVGVDTVLYLGRGDCYDANASNVVSWVKAKAGYGATSSKMGPEVGMAKALSEYYTTDEATGETRMAGILKYAHGGTSILSSGSEAEYSKVGNWVSPSYAATLSNISYSTSSGYQGKMYRGFLQEVRLGYSRLILEGYTDINIKGIFWMQGEQDRTQLEAYETSLKFLIADMRKDIGEIVGEDMSELPFIIGEISETYKSAELSNVEVNKAFIALQNKIASEGTNIYIVNSSKYNINTWVNGTNVKPVDGYHWGTEDMFNIGVEVGECIFDKILKVNTEAE